LLLPADISERLDDAQLEAILAHEVFHVERRDNLFAAVHMMVEMLSGSSIGLVDWSASGPEREWACDEDVLSLEATRKSIGAILKSVSIIWRRHLTYVSGSRVGSEEKNRGHYDEPHREQLNFGRKLLLVTGV